MNTLFLLRQINPSPTLFDRLSELQQVFELQDGTYWVDDAQPRDSEYTNEIVDRSVTIGWGLFDAEWNLLSRYRSLDKAEKALSSARPVFKTEVELEAEFAGDIPEDDA